VFPASFVPASDGRWIAFVERGSINIELVARWQAIVRTPVS